MVHRELELVADFSSGVDDNGWTAQKMVAGDAELVIEV